MSLEERFPELKDLDESIRESVTGADNETAAYYALEIQSLSEL